MHYPIFTAIMDNTGVKQEIRQCIDVLKRGGTILYPTDTIWGIGCDATNPKAVEKIYKIKMRMESKSLIVLLDRKEKLSVYLQDIPPIAFDLIERVGSPLTIIYPKAKNLAKNIIAKDGSVAIRIVNHFFCYRLVRMYGKPIVSTSANFSGELSPLLFKDISQELLRKVDYAVNLCRDYIGDTKPSTIIKLKPEGDFEIIRK